MPELFNVILKKTLIKPGAKSNVKVGTTIPLHKIVIRRGEQIFGVLKLEHSITKDPKFVERKLSSIIKDYAPQVDDDSFLVETTSSFYLVSKNQLLN